MQRFLYLASSPVQILLHRSVDQLGSLFAVVIPFPSLLAVAVKALRRATRSAGRACANHGHQNPVPWRFGRSGAAAASRSQQPAAGSLQPALRAPGYDYALDFGRTN